MEFRRSREYITTILKVSILCFLIFSTYFVVVRAQESHDDHDDHDHSETHILLNLEKEEFGRGGAAIETLNKQIDDYSDQIKKIDREIEEQKKLIQTTSSKAGEIQAQINSLNATRKKLQSDVSRTQNIIAKSQLEIEKLDLEMTEKEKRIENSQEGLAESLRTMSKHRDVAFLELAFDSQSISDFLSEIIEVRRFKEMLINKKYELLNLNRELSQKKSEEEQTKEELEKERQILAAQQNTVISTQNAQTSLLSATKSEQSKYEQLLKENQAKREQFETLVRSIESQIKILIDPGTYPAASRGILGWPADTIRITQQFGGTDFAKNNPGIYGRAYHPGTDFGMPIGTKIKSLEAGVIKGQDNTDAYPGCYAWGRWIVVEHDNGLSSLYAHLSSSLVSTGQRVEKGEVIALSGNTGISTGPHLHLSLYITQGLRIGKYGAYKPGGSGCAATNASGPFADTDAYLDPMTYLPAL